MKGNNDKRFRLIVKVSDVTMIMLVISVDTVHYNQSRAKQSDRPLKIERFRSFLKKKRKARRTSDTDCNLIVALCSPAYKRQVINLINESVLSFFVGVGRPKSKLNITRCLHVNNITIYIYNNFSVFSVTLSHSR